MSNRRLWRTVLFIGLLAPGVRVHADVVGEKELAACRQWLDAVYGPQPAPAAGASLAVTYEDAADLLTRGKSWRGGPFKLGEKTYTHGLQYNATKHLRIRLDRPGARFVAEVGLDNNDDTQRGAAGNMGSVTFHVLVGGKGVFASPVMRLNDGARAVDVPLGGATEFELRMGDGGDGRAFDQGVWADATIHFQDGASLRLQDLPTAAASDNPFGVSLVYDGKSSSTLLPKWERKVVEQRRAGRLARTVTYKDAATGLEVRVEAELYSDFPAVEWVAYLKNAGQGDTPIIESIQSLDAAFTRPGTDAPVLHWANGACASFDDFGPRQTALDLGEKLHLVPGGEGKSSSYVMPYFNLARGDGGVIGAIGWTGEWAADFAGGPDGRVSVRAGQEKTHLRLHPGEEIRTPRIALLFYEGDRWHGQNLWRRFVLAHHRPTPGGQKDWIAPITCGNWGGTSAEVHLDNIRKIEGHKLPIEYYWIDAEWFGSGGWFRAVGDWSVKKDLYPGGFKPISDALHATGRKLLLWFEPERVAKGSPWYVEHKEWLLDTGGDMLLWNLADAQARQFLTDFISGRIRDWGIDCYRQDFNMGMLDYCRKADAPDRVGVTEIRYVEGLYAFWDELLKRHPGLIIDNCASGGKRLDFEMVRRGTPFWRTDGPRDAIAHQCHTWGLMLWLPLSAASEDRAGDDYEFRSSMCSALATNWWSPGDVPAEPIRADFPWDWAQRTLKQYLEIRKFYYGDYYPLTNYSQAADVWMAYQLDLPETGEGLIVVLRRPESPYETARLKLRGLGGAARYEITNLDSGAKTAQAGEVLCEAGLEITLNARPGSALLTYKRAP